MHFSPALVVTVRMAARRNWSARCEGRTVAVWTVRGAGQLFEIPAGTKLGKQRAAGRRAVATREWSRYDPDDEAARPQWAASQLPLRQYTSTVATPSVPISCSLGVGGCLVRYIPTRVGGWVGAAGNAST